MYITAVARTFRYAQALGRYGATCWKSYAIAKYLRRVVAASDAAPHTDSCGQNVAGARLGTPPAWEWAAVGGRTKFGALAIWDFFLPRIVNLSEV